MVNPAVTPAFSRRLFAWLLAFCSFSVFSYAQPAPDIQGTAVVCQGDVHFYTTAYTPGHTWSWSVSVGGTILSTNENVIEVAWTGPLNSTQSVNVTEFDPGSGLSGSDNQTVLIRNSNLVCEDLIHLSIEQDGSSEVTPNMLLDGYYNSYDGFQVQLFLPNGLYIGNTATCDYLGLTLVGKVLNDCTPNLCWSTIKVEDKLPPEIMCPTTAIEIPCDTDIDNFPAPFVTDNCDNDVTINLVGYQVNNQDVCTGVWIVRHWIAEDNYNNQDFCTDTLHISPNGPVDFPRDTVWTCTQYDLYPNITDPTPLIDSLPLTGSGTVAGVNGIYCHYNYLHEDDTLQVCGNTFKIIRTWTVVNWCTGEILLEDAQGDDNEQLIVVMDNNKPTITVPVPVILNANNAGVHPQPCYTTDLLPAPIIFDSCSAMTVQIFTAVGEAVYVNGVDGKEGGFVPWPGLKQGYHIVTYKVTDECGNSTELNQVVQVKDLTAPVGICKEFIDVQLDGTGYIEVPAHAFNSASYDNCCLDDMVVKRMGEPDWAFAPSIDFSCDDVPEVMVVFRVYDCAGNWNECMVTAQVNDKVFPVCIPPQQKIIPCTDVPADVTQDWLNSFGTGDYYDNCDATIIELPFAENINACGEGHVIRFWQVTDGAGNTSNCEQHIYVTPASDWIIKFPADFYGECNDIVTADSIEIVNFGCDMIATTYEDQYFALTPGDSACYKIVRTWKVINWCNYDPYVPFKVVNHQPLGVWVDEDDYNNYGSYQYQQIIKIYDDTPPVLSYPYNNTFCSEDATCTSGAVFLPIDIEGVCSNQNFVTYHIDLDDDLTYELHGNNFFDGLLPIGKHRILYVVEDGCGNESQLEIDFEVKDCKKPTAICENGLIVEIMQTGMVPVCATALDYGSYDNCPGDLHISFSDDIGDSCRIFDCFDLGTVPVNIWVTDAAGNQDYCATFIVIQDNVFSCANGQPVSGLVATEVADPLNGVNVMLNSQNGDQNASTGSNGEYEFPGLSYGADYTVTPQKNDDPLNGVTTFDLVLISKHILGATPLDSPYKLIAADANKSNNVSTFDLVEIRKLILMITDHFPNNTSWRFVDSDYQFPNPANPWLEVFPEVINVNDLATAINDADFVAVKIGDVNGSAVTNYQGGGDTGDRGNGSLDFLLENQTLVAGQPVQVSLKAKDFSTVYGFQFTIDFNTELLEFQSIVPTSLTSFGNFGTNFASEGAVTTSWETNPALTVDDGTPIITLNFLAKANGQLAGAIELDSRYTAAEAYVGEPPVIFNIGLDVQNASASYDGLAEGYGLFQNVPNPFGKKTTIGFRLPKADAATLTIFEPSGKMLTQIQGQYAAGYNEIEIDGSQLPSEGLLYYRLETGSYTATRSMSVIGQR